MKINYTSKFKKHFNKRVEPSSNLKDRFNQRVKLFLESPENSELKDHSLKGKKGKWRAFSVTGDVRVVYVRVSKDSVIFFDIGTHNQVY